MAVSYHPLQIHRDGEKCIWVDGRWLDVDKACTNEDHSERFVTAGQVLALHALQSHGMSSGSPDVCRCGARLDPVSGAAEIGERRRLTFAAHQALSLLEAGVL